MIWPCNLKFPLCISVKWNAINTISPCVFRLKGVADGLNMTVIDLLSKVDGMDERGIL